MKAQLSDIPLTEDQSRRLIQVITAEPPELTQGMTGAPDPVFLRSQSEIDAFLLQVTASNQRVLEKAGGFLDPDQFAALERLPAGGIESRKLQAAPLIQKQDP